MIANHLWQSTAFAVLAALVTLALRKNAARTRYWVWLAASLKFAVPFSILTGLGARVSRFVPARGVSASALPPPLRVALDFTQPWADAPTHHFDWPLLVWLCGAAIVFIHWLVRWRHTRAAIRTASTEPAVFGIFRPKLVLPAALAERLDRSQLDALIAHEMCHIRYRDNLAAAFHMLVEAAFWFHPLVWYIGARLIDERERACDEEVLRLGNRPQAYAESILKACAFSLQAPLPCASGVTGGDLKRRIERIMTERIAPNLTLSRKLLLTAVALAAIAAPVTLGLLHAQDEKFEVASVKPNLSADRGSHVHRTAGQYTATNVAVQNLVLNAYNIDRYQLEGQPGWLSTDHFDIVAKTRGTASQEQIRHMLQALLAERFKLAVHRETRQLPIYNLRVAKNGPKLQPSKADGSGIDSDEAGDVVFQKIPMSMLARNLSRQLARPVRDRTGLTGEYDFKLKWTADEHPTGPPSDAAPALPAGPTIFTALQEQLGLRLESAKGPVDIVVIDHVERPTEN